MVGRQAALAARSQLCAGFCPRPSPPHLNLSMANATAIKAVEAGMTWAGDEKARYKVCSKPKTEVWMGGMGLIWGPVYFGP